MAAPSGSSPTGQWMRYLTNSVDIDVDGGDGTALDKLLAEQQSTCQDLERTSSRANESSAADKEASHCREPSHREPSHGSRKDAEHRTGVAASHKRQREDPCEANSSKANREKMRRDRLNDRFVELARSLEGSGQARADRGSILADAVRVLAQLRAETAQLRGSAEQMKEQIRELKAEKSELREEKVRLLANKQQLEEQVRRMAASGAAQSTATTSAAAPSAAAAPPPPGSGAAGAVPLMLHPACEPGKLAALGAPMGLMPMPFMTGGMAHPYSQPHPHSQPMQGSYPLAGNHPGTGHIAYSVPTHPAAAAPTAPAGTTGTAGTVAAAGPQYMAPLPAMMPYGMPGMAPVAMWQWLPQSAVDPSNDQMLRPPVA
ncbi:unnamed protein product [Closterium sp. Naga37s-1]|nr:unnamed protein product [Closterium sp. Naga37s-1]